MRYQFVILASDLQVVINAYKEVGGILEITPDVEGKILLISFDNIDLLAAEGLKVLDRCCVSVYEPSEKLWSMKKEVLNALHEFFASNDIRQLSKPSRCCSDEIIRAEMMEVFKDIYSSDDIVKPAKERPRPDVEDTHIG